MIRSTIALALALASACASGREPPASNTRQELPAVQQPAAAPPSAPPMPPAASAAPAPAPRPPPLSGGVLPQRLKRPGAPGAPGTVRSSVEGCLAAAGEAEASRFPVMRSAIPAVTVAPAPGGATVVHELSHACCLRSEVSSRIEGETAIVVEKLAGTPCRCMCSSTIRTSLGLAAGRWSVVVEYEADGRIQRLPAGTVDVPRR